MEYIEIIEKALDETLLRIDPIEKAKRVKAKNSRAIYQSSINTLKKAQTELAKADLKDKTKEIKDLRSVAQKVIQDTLGNKALVKVPSAAMTEERTWRNTSKEVPTKTESDVTIGEMALTKIPPQARSQTQPKSQTQSQTPPQTILKVKRSYFSVKTRELVFTKANFCCEYVDQLTGRKCASRFLLDIDHIRPVALGGKNALSNLRILCHTHNQLMARRWFGRGKIEQKIEEKSRLKSELEVPD
jgi:5-methylcytosine-specific restriction endonuclease McrA